MAWAPWVGGQFAELLKASGVNTVKELAQKTPTQLYAVLNKTNSEKKLTRRVPSPENLKNFIEQAKNLDPAVFH